MIFIREKMPPANSFDGNGTPSVRMTVKR